MTSPDTSRPSVTGLSLPLRLSSMSRRGVHTVHMRPDGAARAALAQDLDLLALRKVEFRGTLVAEGREDWRLDAVLGATVVQACVVTGAPVTTRIDTPVLRRFVADMPLPQGPEAELPEDDSLEPLRALVDAGDILREALALALPDYPRAPGAALAAPAPAPADDDRRPNPFAALAAMKPPGPGEGGEGV